MWRTRDYSLLKGSQALSEEDDGYTRLGKLLNFLHITGWAAMVWQLTCIFMFVAGASMMLASRIWISQQSDSDCAAQLSVWCKCLWLLVNLTFARFLNF